MLPSPRAVQAARILAGLSQAELAAAAGISRTALSRLEAARVDTRSRTLSAVLAALRDRGVFLEVDLDGTETIRRPARA